MSLSKDIGKKGEYEAACFLENKGYIILERNYRFHRNEIDIIARRDNLLIFVEVKIRSSNAFGYPETFLSKQQAARILEAASEYQYQKNWTGGIRFDIISIEKRGQDLKVTHFKDAFH